MDLIILKKCCKTYDKFLKNNNIYYYDKWEQIIFLYLFNEYKHTYIY